MQRKVVGFIVCILLITATGFSAVGIEEDNEDELNEKHISSNLEYSPPLTGKFDWPMFRYELNNTGYSPSLAPDDDTVLWSKEFTYEIKSNPTIKDEKFYIVDNTQEPLGRGGDVYCLNPFTGEEIWKIAGVWGGGGQGEIGPIVDGYAIFSNMYDGNNYCYGKGKSATTISAPQTGIPLGESVMLTGTVLDQSPAQPGTPCVSKESMALQMEHIHKQMPIAGLWNNETITGVPVMLTAMGPDGYVDIGTTTSSGYYGTFGIAWTPPDEGTYEIIASFEGDDSYGSSGASTFVSVGPAPTPGAPVETEPPTEPPTAAPPTEEPPTEAPPTEEPPTEAPPTEPPPTQAPPPPITTEVAIILAVAIACIIGVGAFWVFRRRK